VSVFFHPDDITVIRNDTGQVIGYRLDPSSEPVAEAMAAAAVLGAALARFENALDRLRVKPT
jgi:hypothetical protein